MCYFYRCRKSNVNERIARSVARVTVETIKNFCTLRLLRYASPPLPKTGDNPVPGACNRIAAIRSTEIIICKIVNTIIQIIAFHYAIANCTYDYLLSHFAHDESSAMIKPVNIYANSVEKVNLGILIAHKLNAGYVKGWILIFGIIMVSRYKNAALIKSENMPKVRKLTGRLIKDTTGFTRKNSILNASAPWR